MTEYLTEQRYNTPSFRTFLELRKILCNFPPHHKKHETPQTTTAQGILLVRGAGLEPARALRTLEPESSESTNSTTRAHISGMHELYRYALTSAISAMPE